MKDRLTCATVLTLVEVADCFVVYCGALRIWLGCLFMKNRKVVNFSSRKLYIHVKNCYTNDFKLVVVSFVLKIWRHYFYGVYDGVFTNNKSLEYVFHQKNHNLRQRSWLELFEDYDMSVLYPPCKENVVVYALSWLWMVVFAHIRKVRRCWFYTFIDWTNSVLS